MELAEEEVKQIYDQALKKAARLVFNAGGNIAVELIFPIWRDAIHEMMMRRENPCPCVFGFEEDCFLKKSPEQQRKYFADSKLSFERFSSILKEAWERARATFLARS